MYTYAKSRKRRRPQARSRRSLEPGRDLPPPPPPPVILLHVLSVVVPPGPPNVTHWSFDADIVQPPALPATLTVNGASPVGMLLRGPRMLELAYAPPAVGGHWACPADAANVTSADGHKLAGGSGTVG